MEENSFAPLGPGQHTLPPLPYAYTALEPVIDEETLRIHHDKHHKKYVDNLNKAELALVEARRQNDYHYIQHWENQLAFNGSGHILHSIYWTVMTSPQQGGSPGPCTSEYLEWYFGGLARFKAQFLAAAKAVEGSGWAVLGYNPAFMRLELLQCEKHQNLTQWGVVPILVCDVWEHAYYLQYKNDRDAHVEAWWQLVNWPEVEARFIAATEGSLPLI